MPRPIPLHTNRLAWAGTVQGPSRGGTGGRAGGAAAVQAFRDGSDGALQGLSDGLRHVGMVRCCGCAAAVLLPPIVFTTWAAAIALLRPAACPLGNWSKIHPNCLLGAGATSCCGAAARTRACNATNQRIFLFHCRGNKLLWGCGTQPWECC